MTAVSTTRRHLLTSALGLGFAALSWRLWLPAAAAQDLAAAKRAGQLGERIDGYLGVVKASTPDEIRAMAEEINARRREEYAAIAADRGVPIEAVQQLAGEKLIARASSGEWVLGADGKWRQK